MPILVNVFIIIITERTLGHRVVDKPLRGDNHRLCTFETPIQLLIRLNLKPSVPVSKLLPNVQAGTQLRPYVGTTTETT